MRCVLACLHQQTTRLLVNAMKIIIIPLIIALLCAPCSVTEKMVASVLRDASGHVLAAAKKTVKVKGYTKKNGTYVPPHTRKAPTHKKK